MKNIYTLIALSACMSVAFCACQRKEKPIEMAEQQRHVEQFSAINLIGSIDIVYRQTDKCTANLKAPSDIIDKISTTIDDGCLNVMLKDGDKWDRINTIDHVTLYTTSPDLVGVSVSGSGSFSSTGLVDTDVMQLSVIGDGSIQMEKLQSDYLKSWVTGAGAVCIDTMRTLNGAFSVTGSGNISAYFLPSGLIDCSVVGSGDINIGGHVNHLNKSVVGSGSINVSASQIRSSSKQARK